MSENNCPVCGNQKYDFREYCRECYDYQKTVTSKEEQEKEYLKLCARRNKWGS